MDRLSGGGETMTWTWRTNAVERRYDCWQHDVYESFDIRTRM